MHKSIESQYPHGGDAPSVARSLGIEISSLIDLSASLNPFAPDVPKLAGRRLESLVPYPDDEVATNELANAMGIDPTRLILTNGGAEAIALVAGILQSGEIVEPEFSLYRRHLAKTGKGAGRWRSNPANPLGTLADSADEAALWDEAFYPIATGTWTRGDDQSWRVGSMTKLWSCAGLRLGYVIAPCDNSANEVRNRRPRWSVNGLALALMTDLLAETDLPSWTRQIHALGEQFCSDLISLGFQATRTEANWVLLHGQAGLREQLIGERVLVRDCENFGLPGIVRVALPGPGLYDAVLSAFQSVGASTITGSKQ